MSTRGLAALRLTAAAAAFAALAAVGWGSATAAPTADSQGYIDSTARCGSASETVVFGSTSTSRVAICEIDGEYVYRGVRLRDGAKLIIPASKSGDGYTAENDGNHLPGHRRLIGHQRGFAGDPRRTDGGLPHRADDRGGRVTA